MRAKTIWQIRRPLVRRRGSRLALNSSRVMLPSKPGSTQPAFWMNRPILPIELRPSTNAVTLAGSRMNSTVVARRNECGGMMISSFSIFT